MASKGKKKQTLHDLSRRPLDSDTTKAFFKELSSDSDRACALVAVASVDQKMADAILTKFIELEESQVDRIFYSKNAVLGTLSNKNEIAYALGRAVQRSQLTVIANIDLSPPSAAA